MRRDMLALDQPEAARLVPPSFPLSIHPTARTAVQKTPSRRPPWEHFWDHSLHQQTVQPAVCVLGATRDEVVITARPPPFFALLFLWAECRTQQKEVENTQERKEHKRTQPARPVLPNCKRGKSKTGRCPSRLFSRKRSHPTPRPLHGGVRAIDFQTSLWHSPGCRTEGPAAAEYYTSPDM